MLLPEKLRKIGDLVNYPRKSNLGGRLNLDPDIVWIIAIGWNHIESSKDRSRKITATVLESDVFENIITDGMRSLVCIKGSILLIKVKHNYIINNRSKHEHKFKTYEQFFGISYHG